MEAKVEVSENGFKSRFVVTNRQDLTAGQLYDRYIGRGQCENFVKAFNKDLAMDQLELPPFPGQPVPTLHPRPGLCLNPAPAELPVRDSLAQPGD